MPPWERYATQTEAPPRPWERYQRPPEHSRAEAEAVANDRVRRQMVRASAPFGLGPVVEPLSQLALDPMQRRAVGRNVRGAYDAVRTQRVDPMRLLSDTGAAGVRAVTGLARDPLGAAGRFIQNAPAMAYGMTAQPFQENDAARDEEIAALQRRDRAAAEAAASRAVTAGGGIATNTAGALLGPLARTPLQGAALAAGLTAPNAIAGGQGSLQQRLPQAIVDTAGAGVIGAGLPLVGRAVSRGLNMPTRAQRLARHFDRVGVQPSLAALNAGTYGGVMSGSVTNAIADNPIAGLAVRPRIGRQLEQAAAASRRIQGNLGQTLDPESAGNVVRRGLDRFEHDRSIPNPRPGADPRTINTRDWSVAAQADAIYDHVLRPVENNPTVLRRTVQAVHDIDKLAASDPIVSKTWADPSIAEITRVAHDIYTRPGTPLTLQAARELRRRLRIRIEGPAPAGGQDAASLRRVYQALTEDIYDSAGPMSDDLRRADQFYANRMQRLHETLAHVTGAQTDTAAFQAIMRASDAVRGDSRVLVALNNSLRPNEMRTLAASILEHMGQPTKAAGGTQAAELGFSVHTLSSNLRNMSPVARRVLFGSGALRQELESLAAVTDALKGVERTANVTGSGRYANLGGMIAGAIVNWQLTLAAMAGGFGLGEALTNPRFVRWLTSASRQPASAGGARQMLASLAKIASQDPALLPVYNQLARAQPESEPYPQAQSQ